MQDDLRQARGRKLSALAFALFLLVLYLPAFQLKMGADESAIRGWQATAMCLAFLGGIMEQDTITLQAVIGLPALANLLFVLVPVALWRRWRVRELRWLLVVTLVNLLLSALALLVMLMLRLPLELLSVMFQHGEKGYYDIHIAAGYVLWVADHALLLAALLIHGLRSHSITMRQSHSRNTPLPNGKGSSAQAGPARHARTNAKEYQTPKVMMMREKDTSLYNSTDVTDHRS